jgi:hypothetical protein
MATRFVEMMPRIATRGESSELGLLKVVPAALQDHGPAIAEAMRRTRDPVERTDFYIRLIRRYVETGGKPADGAKIPGQREGWTGNPSYHAALMPCHVRVLEHFELLPAERRKSYEDAIVRYADFTLELLGGKPIDFDKLGATFRSAWPSRIVPVMPLMLHAHKVRSDEKYVRAVKILFGDLMRRVERTPHGYFPVWTWDPKAAPYDTVYNPMTYERGIAALWSEGQLDLVGRDLAARFVTAQARWFVYSGQLLDTLEMDNPTAIRATAHGGHTMLRDQIGIYLYDDFAFYRGLFADLVTWSAASCQVPGRVDDYGVGAYRSLELSNAGSSMLRWALGIRPGSTWREAKVQRHKAGFTLRAWNRKVRGTATTRVTAKEAGLQGETDLLEVQLREPAYRLPLKLDVSWSDAGIALKLSRAAEIRIDYGVIHPDWAARPVLQRRRAEGGADTVREGISWKWTVAGWQAAPGEYELRMDGK